MTECTLGDLVALQRRNTHKGALLGLPGPVLLGLGSIERDGGFKGSKLKTYEGTSDPRMLLAPGDVFVSLKDVNQAGDLLGAVARVPPHISIGRLTQDTVKLVPKSKSVSLDLVYWTLRTPQYRTFCRSHATGTTNLGLPREDFLSFPIPALTEELSNLVGLLQSLDDKVELNRRKNATLEAMARALFRDWFVDFGPTRAKMAGQASYLSRGLWDLFPDSLDANGKPDGWEVFTLGQLAEHHTKYVNPLNHPSTAFEHFSLPAFDKDQSPALDLGATIKSNKTLLPNGSVLLSKLNPEIQRVWMPEQKTSNPQVCSTEFLVFMPRAISGRGLLFTLFCSEDFREALRSMVTGTSNSHQRILPPALVQREVINGSPAIFAAFEALVTPLFDRISSNRAETRTLAETRDLLLPRLMSGELQVAELISVAVSSS